MRLIDADALSVKFDGHTVSVWKNDLDAAPTINPYEWISVDERLPDETQGFLVVLDGEDIDIRLFNSRNEPYQTYSSMMDKFLFLDNRGDWHTTDKVTHWMPLPAPPTN